LRGHEKRTKQEKTRQDIECERNRARHDQLVAEAKIKELGAELAAYRESQKEVKK